MSGKSVEKLLIFGAGGHAKSVISVALAQGGWDIIGAVADDYPVDISDVLGVPVLGGRETLVNIRNDGVRFAFVAIGDDQAREEISQLLVQHNYQLANIIHPTAQVMANASLADGILLHAYCLIGAETDIGQGCIIQPHVSVGHESKLGAYVQLCPGARVGGQTVMGNFCFLGPNAVIYPQISLGECVAVGANTTVNKSVASHQSVVEKSSRYLIERSRNNGRNF